MDISYLLMLQNSREVTNGLLNSFMSYITTYGEELLTMMIVAAIYWCVDKNQDVIVGCGFFFAVIISWFVDRRWL